MFRNPTIQQALRLKNQEEINENEGSDNDVDLSMFLI